MVFSNCENIEISDIYVDNHNRIPNNDGVHFSASRNIVVKNSTFLCGDDCFAATCITNWDGICENMVISDCLMSSRSAAIRFGHLESKVRNIVVKNIKIIRSNRALAVFCGDNGYVKNAVFENIESDTKIHAGYWWGKGEPIVVCGADVNGEISDVEFKNCKFVHENPALFVGNKGNVKNVTLTNCVFKQEDGSTVDFYKNKMDLQPNVPELIPHVFDKTESVFVKEVENFKNN
jgi:polygalacturonase